jgi:hypothetical protein
MFFRKLTRIAFDLQCVICCEFWSNVRVFFFVIFVVAVWYNGLVRPKVSRFPGFETLQTFDRPPRTEVGLALKVSTCKEKHSYKKKRRHTSTSEWNWNPRTPYWKAEDSARLRQRGRCDRLCGRLVMELYV